GALLLPARDPRRARLRWAAGRRGPARGGRGVRHGLGPDLGGDGRGLRRRVCRHRVVHAIHHHPHLRPLHDLPARPRPGPVRPAGHGHHRRVTTLGPVTETMQTERSLILIKPDGFRRGLTGEVIRRIEAKGYTLAALAVVTPTREQLAAHYAEHEGKPFYEPLLEFMSSGPAAAVVIEGEECIKGFRSLAGATKPTEAAPGTIRGDLGRKWSGTVDENIVHGSDSPESAEREIGIWFPGL